MKSPTRGKGLQKLFLCLLFICIAQVSYWVVEQVDSARHRRDAELARISSLNTLSGALNQDSGQMAGALSRYIDTNSAAAVDGTDPIQAIHDEYESRRSRLLWEGSFFVLVLFGTMGVISRTLREGRVLVERQQNFIASISHELRTPLASLKLSADTLGLRAPDAERSARLAARMSEDVDRLSEMVSQILQSARLEAEATGAPPVETPLGPLLEAEVQRMHAVLEPRGVRVLMEDVEDLQVLARPAELKTVITNLLSNAGKSCRAGGGGTVLVSTALDGDRAKITISDDGIGFDPSESERIFQRFYRPGDEMRRETSGYGLGLYLVQELTRLHGGAVHAHSDGPGQGAELTLWWPTVPAPALT